MHSVTAALSAVIACMRLVTATLLGGHRLHAFGDRRRGSNLRLSGANCRLLGSAGGTLGEADPASGRGGVHADCESREVPGSGRRGSADPAGGGGRGHRRRGNGTAGAVALLPSESGGSYFSGTATRARGGPFPGPRRALAVPPPLFSSPLVSVRPGTW